MEPVRKILLLVVAIVLALPPIRFALDEFGPDAVVDFTSPEWKAREELITRARVFPASPPADPHPLDTAKPVDCRYLPKRSKATTPKFDCELAEGQVVKVKYGFTPEKRSEVAATRLLAALGFPADHVTTVHKLRCKGCPLFPFQMRRLAEAFFAVSLLEAITNKDGVREFEWVAVERRMRGRPIEVGPHEGWDWNELPRVDPAKGGATRAEIDALRLVAIFLNHWDNKAANQRLICEEGEGGSDPKAPCRTPLLMLQDVGATFGPTKVDYEEWVGTPIWIDRDTCTVSLENLPFHGGNFGRQRISEPGRALLAERLARISDDQIRAIFESARFPDPDTGLAPGDISKWVIAFQRKVREIVSRPACPSFSN